MGTNGFHVTSGGVGDCNASVKPCPLKGAEHYATLAEAQAAYDAQGSFSTGSYSASVQALAGGRYYGAEVNNSEMQPMIDRWRNLVGAERAESMGKAKAARDRGYKYHVTVVRPGEKVDRGSIPQNDVNLRFVGIGSAKQGDNEAWFVVVRSPQLARWRKEQGLPPQDFHVTLGFKGKDVHGVPKDASTIIERL